MYSESLPIKHIFQSGERFSIQFLPFSLEWQSSAQDLILTGLREHFGTLNYDLNPDLENINDSYLAHHPRQTFLLAICKNQVVGTGALISEPEAISELPEIMENVGRICRMSVDQSLRHQKIASSILFLLENEAHRFGYRKIVLETTKEWVGVRKFYQSCGFIEEGERNGDIHFFKKL